MNILEAFVPWWTKLAMITSTDQVWKENSEIIKKHKISYLGYIQRGAKYETPN